MNKKKKPTPGQIRKALRSAEKAGSGALAYRFVHRGGSAIITEHEDGVLTESWTWPIAKADVAREFWDTLIEATTARGDLCASFADETGAS